ncbi:MAG: hypothetical protein VXW57_10530, partial [Pseudomonadota bacterium]|nr:hypothetical protein [Pseudomonadota bacterium]
AIAANDPDAVAAAVERVSKGLRVMDRQCELAGVQPPEPEVWEFDLDGRAIAIVHDAADWKRAEASHPGRELFTLREAAVALVREKLGTAMLGEVVRLFPGAEPAPPTRKPNPQPEDGLPF